MLNSQSPTNPQSLLLSTNTTSSQANQPDLTKFTSDLQSLS
jgi:hypothetical protein